MSGWNPRAFLWYIGWLVMAPALGWAVVTHNFALAAVALALLVVCLALSLRRMICPQCGHAMRTITYRLRNCPQCGTAYTDAS